MNGLLEAFQYGEATGRGAVVLFEYPAEDDLSAPIPAAPSDCGAEPSEEARERAAAEQVRMRELEERLRTEFETRARLEAERSFEAGREAGRRAEREQMATSVAAAGEERKRNAAELVEIFTRERDHYLSRVEEEVVALALAVAARILRREAQMDPLLLTGAVRVALGQLGASTRVRLRVPREDLALWAEAMALVPNLAVRPEIEGVDGMRLGECVVETELGSVDLGIRTQLAEIERGFFDRAGARRPGEIEAGRAGQTEEVRR